MYNRRWAEINRENGRSNSEYADFIKSGAPARSERLAKYNRLLEIEEKLSKSNFDNSFKIVLMGFMV